MSLMQRMAVSRAERSFVTCPACDQDNAALARSCGACGAPLLHECPHCDAVNDPSAAACHKCGLAILTPGEPLLDQSVDDLVDALEELGPVGVCSQCGALSEDGALLCHQCEASLTPATRTEHAARPYATPVQPGAPVPAPVPADASTSGEPVETPSHYVGELTAPTDEAELPPAEASDAPSRRRRLLWMLAVALVLGPPVVSVAGYAAMYPETVDRAVEHARAIIGSLIERSSGAQTRASASDVAMGQERSGRAGEAPAPTREVLP